MVEAPDRTGAAQEQEEEVKAEPNALLDNIQRKG